jgi:hypothetical protein
MSSASSVLPSDLVSVEVAAQQVGAHPQTSLTRCTFPVRYPVRAPERGPRWQTHAQRRKPGNLGPQTSLTRCTFPVRYPVLAPERGPRWQTHAQRRNLRISVCPGHPAQAATLPAIPAAAPFGGSR